MLNLKKCFEWAKSIILIKPGARLSQRVVFAGAWMLALRISARGLGMLRIFILARLLVPDAFGLVAIALMTNELVNQLSSTGFNHALVQRKGNIERYLDTVWTMLVIRGLLLGIVVLLAAPLFAEMFDAPQATPFIRAMAIAMILRGFWNSGIIYFNKELEIHKRFVWEMSSAIAEFAVAISTAFIFRNAWAMVYGAIAGGLVSVIVSYLVHPYRPRFELDFSKAKELFGFGMWLFFSAILVWVLARVDSLFVGRILGVAALGLYTIAHTISDLISTEIGNLTFNVVFPAYSKLQDNLAKMSKALYAGLEVTALLTFPFAVGVFVLAPDFIPLVLGEEWASASSALRILCFAAAIFSLNKIENSLLLGVGKPRLNFLAGLAASVIMVSTLIPLTNRFGLSGAATAVLIGNVVSLVFLTCSVMSILRNSIRHMLPPLISPVVISLLTGISMQLMKNLFGTVGIGELISLLCLAVAVYGICTFVFWKLFRIGPMQIVGFSRGNY